MRYVKPLQLYQDFMQIWMQSEAIGCPALAALHVDNNFEEEIIRQITYELKYICDCSILLLFFFYSFLKEINVLGLVVTVPDITLMDTHDGGHPENFIDDMRKKGKLDGLKYTYWNRAICPRCRKLKDTDIRRAVLLHGGAAGITVWSSSSSWWSASREEPICSYGEAIC
ncbi:hypothetical protein ACOSQ2_011726 [Xanthoceras sorbifolium]